MSRSSPVEQIVYADYHDEITTLIDKLQRIRGGRVVLVANNTSALHNAVNLRLLQRKAAELGLELTLVCGDRGVRNQAKRLGLRAVRSLGALHEETEESATAVPVPPRPVAASFGKGRRVPGAPPFALLFPSLDWQRWFASAAALPQLSTFLAIGIILGLMAAGIWGVLYLALPHATVQLTPVRERFSAELQMIADPRVSKPQAASGEFPARTVLVEVTDNQEAPATGKQEAPSGRAEGSVIIQNRIAREVRVPKGTVLLTRDNRRFLTVAEVKLDPTSATSGRFSFQRVAVVAEQPGPLGNVEKGAISRFEDETLNQWLMVTNEAPTQGGSMRSVTLVTEEDRKQLYEKLRASLAQRAQERLVSQVDPAKEIVVLWIPEVEVQEASYDKAVGDEGEKVSLRMKVALRGTVFQMKYVQELVPQVFERQVKSQRKDYSLLPATVQTQPPEVLSLKEGAVSLQVRAEGDIVPTWDVRKIRRDLVNKTREEAEAYLKSLPGLGQYNLTTGPGWYQRLPRFSFRINIQVQPPQSQQV